MSTVTISKKGWIVIPKEIRDRYKLKPGDKVSVVDYAGHIAIVLALTDPIRQAAGMLKGGPSLTQALLEDRKDEKAREERKLARWS